MSVKTLEKLLIRGARKAGIRYSDATVTSADPYLVRCTGDDEPMSVTALVARAGVGQRVAVVSLGVWDLAVPFPAAMPQVRSLQAVFAAGSWAAAAARSVYLPHPAGLPTAHSAQATIQGTAGARLTPRVEVESGGLNVSVINVGTSTLTTTGPLTVLVWTMHGGA